MIGMLILLYMTEDDDADIMSVTMT